MKTYVAMLWTLYMVLTPNAEAQIGAPLRLVQTISLPNVEGYFDHMAVDIKGQRLFVPGEHQRTIEVVDLRAGRVIHTVKGFGGDPRKTIYIPQSNEIWVDDGDGTCKVFSGDSYRLLKNIPLYTSDADKELKRVPDNGIYDPIAQKFYLANRADHSPKEGTKGSIEIVDTKRRTYIGGIALDGTNPAGIALDPATSRMYVILGDTSQVAVVDREKRTVLAIWPITGGPEPHAVDLDAAHHRLFVGSRVRRGHLYKPGKMVVMDAETGKVIQALDSEGGADELVYDAPSQRIYLTGTTGAVDVFKQVDPDHYELLGKVPTGAIAKTSLLVPELKRFYVAVPKHVILTPPIPESNEATIEEAKILVYEVLP